MSHATERFSAAVEEFARQVSRLRPREPLSEDDANRFGDEAVHETRERLVGTVGSDQGRGPLRSGEIEAWIDAREERRRREGYDPT